MTDDPGEFPKHLWTKFMKLYRGAHPYHEAAYQSANGYWHQALTKKGPEAAALFARSEEMYLKALELMPDYFDAANQCGRMMMAWAKSLKGKEADAIWERCHAMFERALAMKDSE